MNTSNEEQETVYNSAYNPFPEPQTIPSGWDMSEYIGMPHAESVMDEEDTDEG